MKPEWQYTVVDVSDNNTTVTTSPAILHAVIVTTALSAHALPILDGAGGSTVASLAASAAIGTYLDNIDVVMQSGIYVDPNDSGTGMVTVIWRPTYEGFAA